MRIPALILFAFALLQTTAGAENTIFSVGIMLCQTGNCADWGSAALKGARLAQDELNAKGGILSKQVALVTEDTAESISGAQAVTAFHRLLDRKLHFLIGPSWSPGALAIAPIAAGRSDVLVITPSASAREFSQAGANIFNLRPAEELSTRAVAQYAFREGMRRAAILASQQPGENAQGNVFEDEFVRLGGKVAIRVESDPSMPDLRAEAFKIVTSKPDMVFLMNYTQLETGARALRALGYRGMRTAISLDNARISGAGDLLEGVYVGHAPEPSAAFRAAFMNRYNEEPGLSAENGYDALNTMAAAIEQAKTFEPGAAAKVLRTGTFTGAIGTFSFNSDRQVIQEPVIRTVSGGKLVPVKTPGTSNSDGTAVKDRLHRHDTSIRP